MYGRWRIGDRTRAFEYMHILLCGPHQGDYTVAVNASEQPQRAAPHKTQERTNRLRPPAARREHAGHGAGFMWQFGPAGLHVPVGAGIRRPTYASL